VPFAEVKAVAEFMVKQYLEGVVDTVEIIWPRFKNTLSRSRRAADCCR
jgi:F-type H+-transporting ATPase subunit gamma